MVTCFKRDDAGSVEYVLQPNCSLSWKAAQAAFLIMGVLTAAIVIYFVSLGAWLVLPFAGLELLAVGAGLYLCETATHSREVVRIDPHEILVQRGRRGPSEEHRIPRAWTRVVLATDPRNWYPSRLLLRSHGRETEIGARLVDEERRQLATALGRHLSAIAPRSPCLTPSRPPLVAEGRLPADPAAG